MGYEHCKHCDEHFIECNGGTCDWCESARTNVAVGEAVDEIDTDQWAAYIDEYAPDTPVRVFLKRDRKTGRWFARVNVGGWKRGDSCDALRDSPTKAIAAALLRVMVDDGRPSYDDMASSDHRA